MPERLLLPSWGGVADDADRTRAAIDDWAGSAAIAALVEASGGSVDGRRGTALLDWLDRFAAGHWDFRGGAERNLAVPATLSTEMARLVHDLAPVLGLAGPYRLHRDGYDTVLMTGGMIRAGIAKPRFARELLASGVALKSVVFLGGFRPFAGDELELAPLLGVEGDNEFDAMVRGMELAFGPLSEPTAVGSGSARGNDDWRVLSWNSGEVTLRVVAAPSSDPLRRRANTADTYRFWADRVRTPGQSSVLVATTPIYVPYQGAGAVEVLGLGHGLMVETVGVSESASDLGEYSQRFLAQNHLQEIRSAIGSMRSLRTRLTSGGTSGAE